MNRFELSIGVLALLASGCGLAVGENRPGPATRLAGESSRASSDPAAGVPGSVPAATETATAGPEITGTGMDGPAPYRLRYAGKELALRAHTWCYDGGCVDGVLQDDPVSVGSPDSVWVHVPVDDWDLTASFQPSGDQCGRLQDLSPALHDGWYRLEPAGPAGRYDVTLFAQGGGDMVATFRWTTPTDGPSAVPEARLALIADHDGRPDSYGVELELANLAGTPRSAAARITVTAANGRSLTFDAVRSRNDCLPEGTTYFDGPDRKGLAAAGLGDLPFHYDVKVRLDGSTYRGTADYPADEIHGNEPSVALEFTPPLPALG